MRSCPVCLWMPRNEIFSMGYKVPDGWTLPDKIIWYTCKRCGMIYGDCDKTQADFDRFYIERYGYGVSNPDNTERLKADAYWIAKNTKHPDVIIDFGGAGDGGTSTLEQELIFLGVQHVASVGPNDKLPGHVEVIYASHVLEHIYDLPKTMKRITEALAPDGLLIVDVPDSYGLLSRWQMPILDYNTKHLNHFTMRTILELGHKYGFEAVYIKQYELEFAPCIQVHFKRLDVAKESAIHIIQNSIERIGKLPYTPVNIWGIGDIVWHTLSRINLKVLDYVDNDPAMRGQTYNGKLILERPTNDFPIVVMAQGQRKRLIENIRKMGITNQIIEI